MSKENSIEKFSVDEEVDSGTPAPSYTTQEEAALVRKLDLTIIPLVTLLYLSNFIDRTNVGNARIAGLEKDLKLVGYQYNIGLSVFYIFYAAFEVPSNMLLKRLGANRWIPVLVVGFGLVCFTTAYIKNFSGFIAVRVFLGIFEGGMMPGIAYYLSTYYKKNELVLRVVIFVTAATLAGAFGGLLATAILHVKHLDGVPVGVWRNIFLIEGVITMGLGLIGIFLVQPSIPKNRFLSAREKEIATERLVRDGQRDLKSDVKSDAWKTALTNLNVWICGLAALLVNISVQGISLFMPTLLKGMGYSVIKSNLMSVPPYAVASVWAILLAYLSYKTKRRGIFILLEVPIALAGIAMLVGSSKHNVNYAGIFLITMGVFPQGPILLAWGTSNSAPDSARAVGSAMVVAIGTLGPIITSWIYLPKDAPRYRTGNSVQLGCQALIFLLVSFLIFYNTRENKLRAAGKRDNRVEQARRDGTELGHRDPRFRLAL